MSNLSSLKSKLHTLAERLHDAKQLLAGHATATDEDTRAAADFQSRYDALLAKVGQDGEVDLDAAHAEHQSLEQGLVKWVTDIDKRFNNPPKKNQSVSM